MTGGWLQRSVSQRVLTSPAGSPTRSCGIAGTAGSRGCETLRNKLLFHKESLFLSDIPRPTPGTGEMLLRTAHQLTVENDGIVDTIALTRGISRVHVIREICLHLEPYQAGEKPITGET